MARHAPAGVIKAMRAATAARFTLTNAARELVGKTGENAPPHRPLLEGAAIIVFTSGSTGRPKGVVLSHRAFAGKLQAIDSVLGQDYPRLFYHVQDGVSADEKVDILKSYGERISWRSEADGGQSDAINKGFQAVDCDIMAYLNSDDTLLPGTLACVASFFDQRPEIDFVYGHRVFIDYAGSEIGRAMYCRGRRGSQILLRATGNHALARRALGQGRTGIASFTTRWTGILPSRRA
jgi:hypothetical protein